MADRIVYVRDASSGAMVPLLLHDILGDGTQYALETYGASGGSAVVTGNAAAGAADSGNPVKVGGKYNNTLPTLTDGQRGDIQLDASSREIVRQARSTTGTHSNVTASASSVTILAANANRLGASVFNDGAATLYLDTSGGTASTSNYTVQLAPNSYFEVPANYSGLITGIWASATGNARVVEYT